MTRKYLVGGVMIVLLVVAVIVGIACRVSVYRIESGSMEPDFLVGSLVVDSGVAGLETGRAATFLADGAVVTHVLTGFNDDGSLITRGTANKDSDRWHSPVLRSDVIGRVLFNIPLTAPSFWSGQRIALAIVVLFSFSLITYARLRSSSK